MRLIVVGAKAGADQEWLGDAAADLAKDTQAGVAVVSFDELEMEAFSTLPRSEYTGRAVASADAVADRVREAGVPVSSEARSGPAARGLLLFAEEQDADLIVVGASSRGRVASRVLGNVPRILVERSRRPVLVMTPPPDAPVED